MRLPKNQHVLLSQHFHFRVCSDSHVASYTMAYTKNKRNRVVLTIEEKVKVLDMLDKTVSYFHFTYLNKFSYLNTSKFSVPKGVWITEVLLYNVTSN